jgi:hypothetical protein
MGFPESDNYIWIRPEDRDGSIKIRADVKPKQGMKFIPVASFDLPPADDNLKTSMTGWATCSWTSQAAKSMLGGQSTVNQTVDFTEDDLIMNM